MKKKIVIITSILLPIIILGGVSFAFFNYYKEGESNNVIFGGNITLNIIEGEDDITLTNIFPETPEKARRKNNNTMTFTVTGENSSSEQVIYDIMINHGTEKSGARFNDWDLMFDLVEIINDEEVYLVKEQSYNEINKTAIFEEIVNSNDEVSHTYKLRVWLSENVIISETEEGDNVYTLDDYKTRYATIKVALSGRQADKEYVKVTFNADGGEVVPPYKYVVIGEEYGSLPTPTKPGYKFVGWNGKNLLDINTMLYDYYLVSNDNNILTFDASSQDAGAFTSMLFQKYLSGQFVMNSRAVYGGGKKQYTFEKDETFNTMRLTIIVTSRIGSSVGISTASILENGKTYTIAVTIDDSDYENARATVYDLQIEEGETATPYEPYYVTSNVEVTEWNTPMLLTAKWESTQIELSKETYVEEDLTTWEASGVTIDNEVVTLNNMSSTLQSGFIPINGEFWYITFDAYTENVVPGKDYGGGYANTTFYNGNYSAASTLGNFGSAGAAGGLTLNEWNIDTMYDKTVELVKNRKQYGPNVQYVKINFKGNSSYSSAPLSLKNAKIHGQMPNSFYLINIDIDEDNDVSLLKYAKGEHDVAYFKKNGQQVSGTQIRVTENGVYTVYAKYEDGYEGVYTIEIANIVE